MSGNADFNPFELSAQVDPYTSLRTLREQEPVFFSSAAGMWVVTRYTDVVQVLRQPEIFSSENALWAGTTLRWKRDLTARCR